MQYLCPLSHWSKTSKKVYFAVFKTSAENQDGEKRTFYNCDETKEILLASCVSLVWRWRRCFHVTVGSAGCVSFVLIEKMAFPKDTAQMFQPTRWCCAATEAFCQSCWICIKSKVQSVQTSDSCPPLCLYFQKKLSGDLFIHELKGSWTILVSFSKNFAQFGKTVST